MWIQQARVQSYKSLLDSGDIELGHGFSVIIGQNNVGKTALAEALSIGFRSVPTVKPDGTSEGNSSVEMLVGLDGQTLLTHLRSLEDGFTMNVSLGDSSVYASYSELSEDGLHAKGIDQLNEVLKTSLDMHCRYEASATALPEQDITRTFPITVPSGHPAQGIYGKVDHGQVVSVEKSLRSKIPVGLYRACPTVNAYFLKAERSTVAPSTNGLARSLNSDGSNLAEVLRNLQWSDMEAFNSLVRQVLPQVQRIEVQQIDTEGTLDIKVWETDPNKPRERFATSLAESGSGFGQVLAILYVVLDSDTPRVIIIDEPQTYLHPGAIRRLFAVLKRSDQHQYIITTHSPTVVAAARPSRIILVTKHDGLSTAKNLNINEAERQQEYLNEIGTSLAELFGFDSVLWVEGPTEERCFNIIRDKLLLEKQSNTAIKRVSSTADLAGKFGGKLIEICKGLSEAGGLIPFSAGWILDREGRSDDVCSKMEKAGITFLKRRMYENYLLVPAAVVALVGYLQNMWPESAQQTERCTETTICHWLETHARDQKYAGDGISPEALSGDGWITQAHGAKLLHNLVRHFAGSSYDYSNNKALYGVYMTEWIVEHAPQELDEIRLLLEENIR